VLLIRTLVSILVCKNKSLRWETLRIAPYGMSGVFFVLVKPHMIDFELCWQGLTKAWIESALSIDRLAVVHIASRRRIREAPGGGDGCVQDDIGGLVRNRTSM